MLSMVFMGLYTLADTLFVSRLAGTLALFALNIVCPVINLIVGLGTMLASGGSAVVAAELGAGREKQAARDFSLIVLSGAATARGACSWPCPSQRRSLSASRRSSGGKGLLKNCKRRPALDTPSVLAL